MLYIFLALYAALGFSISDICTKYMLDNGISNLQYLFWAHGILFITLTIILIIIGTNYSLKPLTNGHSYLDIAKFPRGKLGWIIVLSTLFSFSALVGLIYAFKISKNIGYTSAIVGTTSLMTFFFSWLFFNSKPQLIGIIGAISILFGVYLISRCDN